MNRRKAILITLPALVFAAGSGLAADPSVPSQEEVQDQIRIMEQSVTESSVTDSYSEEQRNAKLELLDQAWTKAEQGDIQGAMELIEQAGRMLYPVQSKGVNLEGEKRTEWLESVDKAIDAILPEAYQIAKDKGADTSKLDEVARQQEADLRIIA